MDPAAAGARVDTGENMVETTTTCDMDTSVVSEWIAFRKRMPERVPGRFSCEYSRWDGATSNCHVLTCVFSADAPRRRTCGEAQTSKA